MKEEYELTSEELDLIYRDLGFFATGWFAAQALFRGYEAHVPVVRRLLKLGLMLAILFFVRIFGGRKAYYGLLLAMSTGIAVLHGWWFHYKHGVHWRTAEPRDVYLELIGESGK